MDSLLPKILWLSKEQTKEMLTAICSPCYQSDQSPDDFYLRRFAFNREIMFLGLRLEDSQCLAIHHRLVFLSDECYRGN